jgi:hypothetical protein
MMWKSAINSGPNPDEEGYAEWLDEVMQEPWVLALEELVKWSGVWTGTGEQLIRELKARVGKEVRESKDFPSSLEQLFRYMDCAIDGISRAASGSSTTIRSLPMGTWATSTYPDGDRTPQAS